MRAIYPTEHSLTITEAPLPRIKATEVLIKVHACGVNRADILQRKGHYPPPVGESEVLGLEVSGEVVEVGSICQHAHIGDRVFALLSGGGYAEYVAIDEDLLMPIPANLSFEQAAGIAEVFLTAYQSLFWLGNLTSSETILIHAGAGGVGTAGIQLAKLANARIVVTTSSEQKAEVCKKLGAHHAINYKESDFAKEVLGITNNNGVNVIVDSIGANYFKQNLTALAVDGRLVMLALQSGSKVDQLNLSQIISKRLTIVGSTLRNRHIDYKKKLVSEFSRIYFPFFETGTLAPVVDSTFDWQQADNALTLLESNATIGKIILTGM